MANSRGFQTVSDVLASMPSHFHPAQCSDLTASVHWKLTGSEAQEFTIFVDRGSFELKTGAVEKADLMMEASSDTYLRLANGELSGVVAIMTRKLRVRGRIQLAARWDRIFS